MLKSILTTIGKALSSQLLKLAFNLTDIVKQTMVYLNTRQKEKKAKKDQEKKEAFEKKVDNVVDNGKIDDLLELR